MSENEKFSVSEIFGENVFNDSVMQARLPKKVYKRLHEVIEGGQDLDLATADVASFLYEQLKMYDGLDTIFSNIDLKLGNLEQKAANREQIVQYLQDNYVSAANESQPIMLTIN